MSEDLATIKKHLPYGYERLIANEVGCRKETVHNILNGKVNSSGYSTQVLSIALRMANERIETVQALKDTAKHLNDLDNGSES